MELATTEILLSKKTLVTERGFGSLFNSSSEKLYQITEAPPMLYLDSGITLHGITLYRDYSNLNHYYYLPASPHLTREGGQPLFQLLIYRRDITDNPAFKEGD